MDCAERIFSVTLNEASARSKENPEKAEEIFKKIDKDANGELSLEEFKSQRPPEAPNHRLRPLFPRNPHFPPSGPTQ